MSESISNSSDEEMIRQVLAGDKESFSGLVHRYQNRLFYGMWEILRNEAEAEEVVQEAFFKAFSKLEVFRGSSSFYTWLYRIAFNLAITRIRRRRSNVSLEDLQDKSGVDRPAPDSSPGAAMEQRERVDQVKRALEQLSEQHRQILVLREIENLDYEAIGEILDLPVGTVRSRLYRAREQMRQQLNLIDQR